jgi:hypothetical protein
MEHQIYPPYGRRLFQPFVRDFFLTGELTIGQTPAGALSLGLRMIYTVRYASVRGNVWLVPGKNG